MNNSNLSDIVTIKCWLLNSNAAQLKVSVDGKPRHGVWLPRGLATWIVNPNHPLGRQGRVELPLWLAKEKGLIGE